MTRMRFERAALLLMSVVLMPLLMGAGGFNPGAGIPAGTKVGGTLFKASVVIDTHNAGATTTAGQASIRLYRDPALAAAIFEVPVLLPFDFGCDLGKTDTRFLNVPLINWIPADVLNQLFITLRTPRIPNSKEPVITHIESDTCTPDPANRTTEDGSHPGILSFQADVRFLIPK